MPEITIVHVTGATIAAIVGIILGWAARGSRGKREKAAINAGWQEQLEAKRVESDRLQSQNKALMEKISRLQGEDRNAGNQARELSAALKESLERRAKLERQLEDARRKIQIGAEEFKKLKATVDAQPVAGDRDDGSPSAVRERDEKIAALNDAIEQWKDRMQPLIDKYRKRDAEAIGLEAELAEARERISELEAETPTADDDAGGETGGRNGSEDNVVSIRFAGRSRSPAEPDQEAADDAAIAEKDGDEDVAATSGGPGEDEPDDNAAEPIPERATAADEAAGATAEPVGEDAGVGRDADSAPDEASGQAGDDDARPAGDSMLSDAGENLDEQIMAAVKRLENELAGKIDDDVTAAATVADRDGDGDAPNDDGSDDTGPAGHGGHDGEPTRSGTAAVEHDDPMPTLNIRGPVVGDAAGDQDAPNDDDRSDDTGPAGHGGQDSEPTRSGTAAVEHDDPTPTLNIRGPVVGDAAGDDTGRPDEHEGTHTMLPSAMIPALTDDGEHAASEVPDETDAAERRDDLQRIDGIGPTIAKTLNELGIFRFAQIVSLSDYDIERIEKRLGDFRSRVEDGDWIGQARRLLAESTGETV